MQIPILSGIYADGSPDFRSAYPLNLVPTPKSQGISEGYLRPADGIVQRGTGPGVTRGGIEWNGVLYRVMGTKLVSINQLGTVRELGDVGGSGPVSMAYSFDYLAVASGEKLYLWDGNTLQQNTDTDLGAVLDLVWVDGYFMTTDGENLVVTELNDPFSVKALKYGSSEVDPDPVVAVVKLRNEIYAVNRHTIEVFANTGGSGFPFERISGAQVHRGAVGTHACTVFMGGIAFLGGGYNESLSVHLGGNGAAVRIATREIEQILQGYSESDLVDTVMEVKKDKGHETLLIHLPNETVCYDGAATQAVGQPVWYRLSTSVTGEGAYRAKYHVWAYDAWQVGDPTSAAFGNLDSDTMFHWGIRVGWEFQTPIVYNENRGAIFHELDLIALTGSVALGVDPQVFTQYSEDGVTWSQKKWRKAGKRGARSKLLRWVSQGTLSSWRIQRFGGTSDIPLSIARLEARLEPLAW